MYAIWYKISDLQVTRWVVYTGISSILCIMGGFMVPIVSHFVPSSLDINTKLLNYGLSTSAGAMLCSSIYIMLPRNEENQIVVFVAFSTGVVMSFVVNYIVHRYTSESVIHCGHEGKVTMRRERYGSGSTVGLVSMAEAETVDDEGERQRLLPYVSRDKLCTSVACIPLVKSASMGSLPSGTGCNGSKRVPVVCLENNIGYDLENLATYRGHFMSGTLPFQNSSMDESFSQASNEIAITQSRDGSEHKHVIATPFSKLLSIGIQTCVVLMLHKFPEGLIIFLTSRNENDNRQMGFSVFLSLAIHNFIEGFTMTLPLYSVFSTKWLSLAVTAVIAAGSQPAGAVVGYFLFHNREAVDGKHAMTVLLSVTSGFLFIVALQMFQTAVAFSDTHHHHEYEDNQKIHSDHSSGTECLKWCCFGVLVVLASSML
ncbi:HDL386Wp [Eremothecium sinecaudum]|uniref:HDL386Wp n=1 Tax=Eremothecium sinecaudum TaxID=45286 RepID=A0A109UZ77_9SACH|nr:HDL386Wp [Eremothecium sinecaudum]AMD20358.1 HDL386Wp [Eremothecium sinecaudum]